MLRTYVAHAVHKGRLFISVFRYCDRWLSRWFTTYTHSPLLSGALSFLQDLAQGPSASELEAALKAAKVERHLRMENPTDALFAMARGAREASDLDGVTLEAVKSAAAEAIKTGLTMASVGNIGDVSDR